MCEYLHKNCRKNSIIKFLAYRVYEGYDKSVQDETSHTYSGGERLDDTYIHTYCTLYSSSIQLKED
jgi:hypothetical protein